MGQSSFSEFLALLPATLTSIKSKTGSIFLPICLTQSPAAPLTDIIIVLKAHSQVDQHYKAHWFTDNIEELCGRVVLMSHRMNPADDSVIRKNDLAHYLDSLHKLEGLHLIGGFQTKAGDLQIMLIKFKAPLDGYRINVEHLESLPPSSNDEGRDDRVESLVNDTHIGGDGFLISVLTMREESGNNGHFFVFHERPGDALYTVQPFGNRMQKRLDEGERDLDDEVTKELFIAEHRLGCSNCLIYVVVNYDFKSSVIITSA